MDAKRIRKNTTGLLMSLVLAFYLMPHVAKAQINPRAYYQVGWAV